MVPSQKSPVGPHFASLLRFSGRSASGAQNGCNVPVTGSMK